MRRAIVRGAIIGGTAYAVALAVRRGGLVTSPWTASDDRDVPRSLNNLAVRRLRRGLDESAEPLFHTAREMLERAEPPRQDSLFSVRANLAALATLRAVREGAASRHDAARRLLGDAIALLEDAGPRSSRMLARALANLGRLERLSGDPDAGTQLFERALQVRHDATSSTADDATENLMAMADLYQALDEPGAADVCLEHAAAILQHASGPGRARLGTCLSRRATLAHAGGRLVEAGSLYRHALRIKTAALGPRHPSVARTLEDHAALLRELDRPVEASALEKRARPIRARSPRRDPLRRVDPLDTVLIPLSA